MFVWLLNLILYTAVNWQKKLKTQRHLRCDNENLMQRFRWVIFESFWFILVISEVLCSFPGGFAHHRNSSGNEQVHRFGRAAPADPLRSSLLRHRASRRAHRLHALHCLPPVQGLFAHQSPARRHRGVSAGHLQVRTAARYHAVMSSWSPCQPLDCTWMNLRPFHSKNDNSVHNYSHRGTILLQFHSERSFPADVR